jgi:hypothetical protein
MGKQQRIAHPQPVVKARFKQSGRPVLMSGPRILKLSLSSALLKPMLSLNT